MVSTEQREFVNTQKRLVDDKEGSLWWLPSGKKRLSMV